MDQVRCIASQSHRFVSSQPAHRLLALAFITLTLIPYTFLIYRIFLLEVRAGATLYTLVSWTLLSFSIMIAGLAGIVYVTRRQLGALLNQAQSTDYTAIKPLKWPCASEIRQLSSIIDALRDRQYLYEDEIKQLKDTIDDRVADATRELRRTNTQLETMARKDHLTALANRRHFEHTLVSTLNGRRTGDGALCILLVDIDNFKSINDRHGHPAGDAVLMQIAMLLEKAMRPGDLVARYGGDEFVALMHCPEETGLKRANDIRQTIDDWEFRWHDNSMHVTVSIGLLGHPEPGRISAESMLRYADNAMYQAKQRGRNTVIEMHC